MLDRVEARAAQDEEDRNIARQIQALALEKARIDLDIAKWMKIKMQDEALAEFAKRRASIKKAVISTPDPHELTI